MRRTDAQTTPILADATNASQRSAERAEDGLSQPISIVGARRVGNVSSKKIVPTTRKLPRGAPA